MKNKAQLDGMPVWFDGKSINEALFCEEFLQTHKIIFRCLGCVLHFPAFQKMQIIAQHPQAAHFLLPVCFQQRSLRFGEGSCRRGLVRVNPEILCQLLRCLVVT